MKRPLLALTATALAASVLSACGSSEDAADDGGGIEVVASFYPLEHAAARVGGEHVSVTNLTKPGAEAHDLELTPKDMLGVTRADLLVYLKDFQPAVDDAAAEAGDAAFDVSRDAHLDLGASEAGHEGESPEEHAEHAEEGHEGHDHGATDPHFWLDPMRYAAVAQAIGDRLAEIDPANSQTYQTNSQDLQSRLTELNGEFGDALGSCAHEDLVTSHAAFGYLADRYDLHQVGIAGLTPDMEPSAAGLRDLISHVREAGVSTVYAETLVDPALAETIAREADVEVRTLDPLEGLTDASAGTDYFEVMRSNLEVLTAGQECA